MEEGKMGKEGNHSWGLHSSQRWTRASKHTNALGAEPSAPGEVLLSVVRARAGWRCRTALQSGALRRLLGPGPR